MIKRPCLPLRPTSVLAAIVVAILVATTPAATAAQSGGTVKQQAAVLLQLSHSKRLSAFVRAVSDPSSEHYRQYRTFEQLITQFAPPKAGRRSTLRWAGGHGPQATISPQYTRQAVTDPSVDQSAAARTGTAAGCPAGQNAQRYPGTSGWTPNQYLTAYGHSTLSGRGLSGTGQRVALIEIDGFEPSDISAFAACFGYSLPPIRTIPVGMSDPFPAGPETTLDLEILTAAVPKLESVDVYESGDPVLSMIAALSNLKTRPDVISISIAGCENNAAQFIANVRMLDTLFELAAGTGTSVLVATGDTGSTGCLSPSPEAHAPLPVLSPSYPATSPFVTAVGGTNIELDQANQLVGQWVWNNSPASPASGTGGLSLLFAAPWWQKTPLNSPQRMVPDISALADNQPGYAYYCTAPECAQIKPELGWMTVGGTSAAAPLVAAGIAQANQAAAKRGQASLGFLNPLIYALANSPAGPRIVSDVTAGTNDVGTTIHPPLSDGRPVGAYSATKGYDMASGWGSLDVARFSDAALGYGR